MDRRQAEALDRHITGNYGEDQFLTYRDDETQDWDEPYFPDEHVPQYQVSNCEEDAADGVLCAYHAKQAEEADA